MRAAGDPFPLDGDTAGEPQGAGPGPGAGRGGFRAFQYLGFRIYFATMLLRGTATWMPLVAIPWAAVEGGASSAEIGVLAALLYLPTVVLGSLGGALGDRRDRKDILIVAQWASGIISLVVGLLVASGNSTLTTLALASVAFGSLTAIEVPVRQAYLTEFVPARDIPSAVALHATAFNITRFVGPTLAGILIAMGGAAAPFLVSVPVTVVVVWGTAWMDRHRVRGRDAVTRPTGMIADIREGAVFAIREPTVFWSVVIASSVALFGLAAFITLAPLYVPEELRLGAGAYGLFVGISGAGGLVAAVLITALAGRERRSWLIAATMVVAFSLAGLAITESPEVAFALAFILGFGQIAVMVNALMSVHGATPDHLRGRVMGIWLMTFQGCSLIGALLFGAAAEVSGIRPSLLVGAAVLALTGLVVAVAIRRVAWRSSPRDTTLPVPVPGQDDSTILR